MNRIERLIRNGRILVHSSKAGELVAFLKDADIDHDVRYHLVSGLWSIELV